MEYPIFDFEKRKEKTGFKWDMEPIEEQLFKDKAFTVPSYTRSWSSKYHYKHFLRGLKKRVNIKGIADHFALHIIGRQGIGKSRVAQQIAKFLYPSFSVDNITFDYDNTLKRAEYLPERSLILQDESTVKVGLGSEREMLDVQNAIETTRDHGLNFVFLSPTERNFSGIHYVLEVVQRSLKARRSKVAIKSPSGTYLGYFIVNIPLDKDDALYLAYLPFMKKNKQKIRERVGTRVSYRELAEGVKKHSLYNKYLGAKKITYLIREQNPTLAEGEVRAVETAYSMYTGYIKKPKEEEKEKNTVTGKYL